MHIVILCKRKPQGRDLLDRPYGRFFFLPYYLSQLGHTVSIVLFSYGNEPREYRHQHGMDWYCHSVHAYGLGCIQYIAEIKTLIQEQTPDWIFGFSDIWYGILAEHFGTRYGIKTLIDAYDNYESYIPSAYPLHWIKPFHWLWRRACRKATALIAAGPDLLELIARDNYGRRAVVPMAADPIFQPMDRNHCRALLGLPMELPLVGYCGSLDESRDIETLFEAAENLLKLDTKVKFVFSGRGKRHIAFPCSIEDRVIDLGYLPDEQIPLLLNSMNVLWSVNRPSSFGQYSHPIKLYEGMQCEVSVVATDVLSSKWILQEAPQCLVPFGDAVKLAERTYEALTWERKAYIGLLSWKDSALILNDLIY